MVKSVTFQALKWEINEDEDGVVMHIHGLDRKNRRVAVKVPDFKPYIYLELDSKVKWTEGKLELLRAFLRNSLHSNFPVKNRLVERKKNYYYRPAKFLWMAFNTNKGIRALESLVKNRLTLYGVGNIKLQVHEQRANPILQLFAMRKIKPAGWIVAKRTKKKSLLEEYNDTFSTADVEIVSGFSDISPAKDITHVVNPKIVSYDIECVSGDSTGNTFPNPSRKIDQVICISATVAYYQDEEEHWKTYALVNEVDGKVCPELKDGSEVRHFKNEKELILGWSDFINEIDPDIITGYNTLSFDDKYMYERANKKMCWPRFSKMGRIIGQRSKTEQRNWSSSAYGDQKFDFIDIPGRLHIDMYPVIFKDFGSLPSYTLDYVSEHFLGDNKIDLPAKEMIQMWYRGEPQDIHKIVTYCNKDTFLPLKLMQKLGSWLGLTEMANVVMVPIFDLVTRGQQIRVFSQVYCLAYEIDVVCTEKWTDYRPSDEAKIFVGATVQDPLTGYWEKVPTFDFKSLYPTTIIAYNLCFSTFVPPDENPPKDQYHDLIWEDHVGCEHDTAVRKTKVTKRICKKHHQRYYKEWVKKGMIPMLLEGLLDARSNTREDAAILEKKIKDITDPEELKQAKLTLETLDKRQLGYKVSGNSAYGGFGSDYSYTPFFEAAAATTAMGRKSIKDAIDFTYNYRKDTVVVYGDTDSAMFHFRNIRTLEECFEVSMELEKKINAIFPKPMYLELEKIYSKYFLLSKKRYVGYIVDKNGELITVDKKGVVIKRRDNCGYLKEVYSHLIDMIMAKELRWKIYDYLCRKIKDLLSGNVDLEKLVITKSIKDNYKSKNLPHVVVAEKMRSRGKYVASGTRIRYIFVESEGKNDPQYKKAEDPDYYLQNSDTIKIDYLYYFEKQLVNPIDEALEVKFKVSNVLKNLLKLLKKGIIRDVDTYFRPSFKIMD